MEALKLDFVCIGAQKAGTTTLHNILNTHPDIYLPEEKEAQFFDINERWEKGLSFYFSSFFQTYNGEKLIGNINPNLEMETRSIDRLIESFGTNIKCIFILRNPVERAYSHYLMSKKRGYENLPFLEALKKEPERTKNPKKHPNYLSQEPGHFEKNHLGYLSRSHYLKTLHYLFEQFPKKNIKLVVFETFMEKKEATIQEILEFLEIPPSREMNYNIKSNVAAAPKNRALRNLIYRPNRLKKIGGAFLNANSRKKLKNFLDQMNTKPLTKTQKTLPPHEKKWIYTTFFKEEIKTIEATTGLDLSRWEM